MVPMKLIAPNVKDQDFVVKSNPNWRVNLFLLGDTTLVEIPKVHYG